MKIVLIVTNSIWFDPRVRRTATSLVNLGLNVTVLGIKDQFYNENEVKDLPFKTRILEELDEKYYRNNRTVFTKIKREYLKSMAFIKACKELKPDIIHANDFDTLPIAYFSAKKNKSKIVYDSHEIYTENLELSERKLLKFIYKTIERLLIRRSDQTITVSHSSSFTISKMYNIKPPIVITNCAVKIDESSFMAKKNDKFQILYHGRFYHGRGYKAFILAANLLKKYDDIELVLRGLGPLENELKKIVHDLKLENKVKFVPPVKVTDLVRYASSSHVGTVLTEPINKNFINTVSNKLFEYINAGLPVILSNVPEHKYLNDEYGFGLIIDEVNPENVAAAVLSMYENKELYKELRKKSIETSKVLNWENEVKKLIKIYTDIYTN